MPDSASIPSRSLPLPPTSLIGRETELAQICDRLSDAEARLLTITGAPGSGKTRLALAVAARLLDGFEHGAVFVPLAPVADAGFVAPAIAQALGIKEAGGRPLAESLVLLLRDQDLLLVLDNFEQVLTAAPLVADLLAACPRLRVLVTSRARLHVRGEKEFPLAPLAVPRSSFLVPRETLPNQELEQADSVRLFVERARDVRPGFALTAENTAAVAAICVRVDGLPLAVELAAARAKLLTPQAMLDRMEPRLPFLTGGARDLPARQQTLRDAIAWSYDLLNTEEQVAFRRLAVFTGGFSIEAAEAVLAPDADAHPTSTIDRIAALVDMSLVRAEDHRGDEPRFTMLATLREYGLEQLAAHGELEESRERHAAFFHALAEAAEPALRGPDAALWIQRLVTERDNLRAALDWDLAQPGDGGPALRLAAALTDFWWTYGLMSEGRLWLERAIARGHGAADVRRAEALVGASLLTHFLGDVPRAKELFEEGLALARRSGDARQIAVALKEALVIVIEEGDYTRARSLLEESLALARELDDATGVAGALMNLGEIARHEGDYPRALQLYGESRHIFRRVGRQMGIGIVEMNLGFVTLRQGELERAVQHFRDSLEVLRRLGSETAVGFLSMGFAAVAGAGGELERAARMFGASAALLERAGFHLQATDRDDRDHFLAAVRAALDEATFAAAWEAGRSMSEEETLAYALRSDERGAMSDESPAAEVHSSLLAPRSSLPGGLTSREVDVLRLIALGISNREIAGELVLSERTVERHIANIYQKLSIGGKSARAAAAAYALRQGLTQPPAD